MIAVQMRQEEAVDFAVGSNFRDFAGQCALLVRAAIINPVETPAGDFEQAAHHAALAHGMLRQICAQIAHNAALLAQMKSRIALIDSPSQLHLIVKTSEDAPRMTEDRKGTRLNSSH